MVVLYIPFLHAFGIIMVILLSIYCLIEISIYCLTQMCSFLFCGLESSNCDKILEVVDLFSHCLCYRCITWGFNLLELWPPYQWREFFYEVQKFLCKFKNEEKPWRTRWSAFPFENNSLGLIFTSSLKGQFSLIQNYTVLERITRTL